MPPNHDNQKKPVGDTWRNACVPEVKAFMIRIARGSIVSWMTGESWRDWKGLGPSVIANSDYFGYS
jgi:hypothetical protein